MTDFPYRDLDHPLNSSTYHTGKSCVEKGCDRPAGTHWSPFWCAEHNAERLERITATLEAELKRLETLSQARTEIRND